MKCEERPSHHIRKNKQSDRVLLIQIHFVPESVRSNCSNSVDFLPLSVKRVDAGPVQGERSACLSTTFSLFSFSSIFSVAELSSPVNVLHLINISSTGMLMNFFAAAD